jgi:rhodanese-related sulfurtransferase/CBS domain-containing protein
MITPIDRNEVKKLVSQGGRLLEVLPKAEYEDEHLPGAINIFLRHLDSKNTAQFNRQEPIVVYCHDYQWDLSARAAWRLVSLGFTQVFRYTPGKADWAASGLPTEGNTVAPNRAGSIARRDVPTCRLSDRVDAVRQQLQKHNVKLCAVLNEHRVLLGQISTEQLESRADGTAEEIMTAGPTTFRPNAEFQKVCDFFKTHKPEVVWVTTSDGELVGLLHREDVERVEPRGEQPACMH